MTLPATPSAGDIVSVKDYAYTFGTNNLTVNRNGSLIGGGSVVDTVTYATNGDFLTFIYVDGTQGWVLTNDSTNTDSTAEQFIVATGGTITCCGDYKIHTFTGPGTFCVSQTGTGTNAVVDYLVVAGGGAATGAAGSGGGAGGFRLSNSTCMPAPTTSPLANPTGITVTASAFPITVGAGGTAPNPSTSPPFVAPNGSPSVFSTITSAGGGGGASTQNCGADGGSGGGGGGESQPCNGFAGSGNTPPTSPAQGTDGGDGGLQAASGRGAGGGGGAACTGETGTNHGGDGGAGSYVLGTGFAGSNGEPGPVCGARYFAGGGGGGFEANSGSNGVGGVGGGGDAGPGPGTAEGNGQAGVTNTGGGGGGGSRGSPGTNLGQLGGNGGSGIVIIRYKYQ
jgi:hypothetical protein